jgi:hypothetical protein
MSTTEHEAATSTRGWLEHLHGVDAAGCCAIARGGRFVPSWTINKLDTITALTRTLPWKD